MPIRERHEYYLTCDQHQHVVGPASSWDGGARTLAEREGWKVTYNAQTNKWSYLCPYFEHVAVE